MYLTRKHSTSVANIKILCVDYMANAASPANDIAHLWCIQPVFEFSKISVLIGRFLHMTLPCDMIDTEYLFLNECKVPARQACKAGIICLLYFKRQARSQSSFSRFFPTKLTWYMIALESLSNKLLPKRHETTWRCLGWKIYCFIREEDKPQMSDAFHDSYTTSKG